MSTSLFFYFLHHNVTENKHAKYMFYSPIFNLFLHSVGLKILNKQIYWSGAKAGKKWQKEHLKLRSDTIVWNLNYNETMLIRPQETGFSNEKIDGCLANTEKKKKEKKAMEKRWPCMMVFHCRTRCSFQISDYSCISNYLLHFSSPCHSGKVFINE